MTTNNLKLFCIGCGRYSYMSNVPKNCPNCNESDTIVEVKG